MRHPVDTVRKIRELRKIGYSISELTSTFSLPKTTVWHYIQGVKIPPKYIKILRSRQGGSALRKLKNWEKATTEAKEIMSSNRKYECSLLAMLYWAEGNNKDFTFTNTNPAMIKIVVGILNKNFGIRIEDLLVTVRYFTGMNKNKCKNYWSETTGVPKKKLKMYYNDGGTRGRSEYGMCRLSVRKSAYLLKVVKSLITNISNNLPSSFNG